MQASEVQSLIVKFLPTFSIWRVQSTNGSVKVKVSLVGIIFAAFFVGVALFCICAWASPGYTTILNFYNSDIGLLGDILIRLTRILKLASVIAAYFFFSKAQKKLFENILFGSGQLKAAGVNASKESRHFIVRNGALLAVYLIFLIIKMYYTLSMGAFRHDTTTFGGFILNIAPIIISFIVVSVFTIYLTIQARRFTLIDNRLLELFE